MKLALALCSLLAVGCLDGGGGDDMSASVDMASPSGDGGDGDAGIYNCLQLNSCEQKCKNLMCVAACRQLATASALDKELALQKCFNQYCPQALDMGTPICAPDPTTGARSQACATCLTNTQQPSTTSCNPTSAPECTKCFNQAQDCTND
jgi:hypothetical protein